MPLAADRADAESALKRAFTLVAAGDVAGAELACAEAIASGDAREVARAHVVLSRCAERTGDLVSARHHVESALRIHPDDATVQYAWAMAQERAGNAEAAIVSLERAVTLQTAFPAALHRLGILLAESGDASRALGAFERVVTLEPAQRPRIQQPRQRVANARSNGRGAQRLRARSRTAPRLRARRRQSRRQLARCRRRGSRGAPAARSTVTSVRQAAFARAGRRPGRPAARTRRAGRGGSAVPPRDRTGAGAIRRRVVQPGPRARGARRGDACACGLSAVARGRSIRPPRRTGVALVVADDLRRRAASGTRASSPRRCARTIERRRRRSRRRPHGRAIAGRLAVDQLLPGLSGPRRPGASGFLRRLRGARTRIARAAVARSTRDATVTRSSTSRRIRVRVLSRRYRGTVLPQLDHGPRSRAIRGRRLPPAPGNGRGRGRDPGACRPVRRVRRDAYSAVVGRAGHSGRRARRPRLSRARDGSRDFCAGGTAPGTPSACGLGPSGDHGPRDDRRVHQLRSDGTRRWPQPLHRAAAHAARHRHALSPARASGGHDSIAAESP